MQQHKPKVRLPDYRLPDYLEERLGRPIAFRVVLARLCGSLTAGLMLSQAIYWRQCWQVSEGWFHKTAKQWEEETFLTLSQQESARKILRRFPFWQEERRSVPATMHFRVDLEKLREALAQFAGNPQTRIGKSANQDQAKHANKNSGKLQSSLHEPRELYMEAEITTESTAARIPPTPLKRGDERSSSTRADKDAGLLTKFKMQLKDEMINASFYAKKLDSGDYDRYFRDTWFMEIRGNVILVDGASRTLTAEGLRKYDRRLKQTFRKLSGMEVDFQMVRIGDSGANVCNGNQLSETLPRRVSAGKGTSRGVPTASNAQAARMR